MHISSTDRRLVIVMSVFQSPEAEELAMLSLQLVSRFLFYTGFHTKKTLRGTATDWYDIVCHHLRSSKAVRSWFANEVLFNHPHRYQMSLNTHVPRNLETNLR